MKNIGKILVLSKPYHRLLVLSCGIIALNALLQQATPVTLKFVIDELTAQIGAGTGDYGQVLFLFGLILAINLGVVVLTTLNQRLGDHTASRLGKFLTETYYRKVFTLPQKYFDSEISGKMVNQLNRGISSIREFIGASTNFIVPALLQAVFGISILMYFDLTVGLVALIIFPLYILISSYSTRKWGEKQVQKNVHEDASRGRIQEVFHNIRLVKTYNTQAREWEFVSREYRLLNKIYDAQSNFYHALNFLREFGLELAFVGILLMLFQRTFSGALTLGEMIMMIQLLNQLRWPLYGMSYMLEQVQRAEADSKEFFAVLDLQSSEELTTQNHEPAGGPATIDFDAVSFGYDTSKEVLSNVSLSLGPVETVALVGHSGAGKSTLINLILKLYEPTKGELVLSGKKYSEVTHNWIRSHIALVFQDTELFSTTIRENVAYGFPQASDKAIVAALKQANAYDFVQKLTGKLEAKIGEQGIKLSGGQKQRLQIARAILHDKPILILDEATSNLDSKSEKLVQDALEKVCQNRLVIIIAHRFSTIQNADRIVVLHKGKIQDIGTPQELATRAGVYSELLRYQVEGNKKLLNQYEIF